MARHSQAPLLPPLPSWPASPSPLRSAPLTQSAHSSTSSGADAQEPPRAEAPGGRHVALGSVADFPFSCHFREGGRGKGQPLHGATGEPASQASREKHKGSRPSPDGRVTWLSHCPSCWGQTGPRGAPSPVLGRHPQPSSGPLGLLALPALGPPAGLVPLKVAGLSTPGIFTHQTGPVSSTHHKYAF